MFKAILGDLRTALADVCHDEIEELVDVSLTVGRMTLSAAQVAARQLGEAADRDSRQTVIIEDLEDEEFAKADDERASPSSSSRSCGAPLSRGDARVVLIPNRR